RNRRALLRRLGRLGMLVDLTFRELGEGLVGLLFLGKRGLKELYRLLQAKLCRPGFQRAVARNLVVLNCLRRCEEPGIEGRVTLEFLHYFLPLFDYVHDAVAGLTPGLLLNLLENLLEPGHMLLGLVLVLLEGVPQVL